MLLHGIRHPAVPACIIEADKEYEWKPWTRPCEHASTS